MNLTVSFADFPIDPYGLTVRRSVIVKIHGAVDMPSGPFAARENYIITENDYIDYMSRDRIENYIPTPILNKLTDSRVLFLGYALGEHARGELAALTDAWPVLPRLRRHVSSPPGSDRLAAVRRATAVSFGEEWAELAAFAEGAGVPFDDLALLNLRGDLGLVDGGIGCSDLAWRRGRSVIAHNEDGAPEDVGRCALLTLASGLLYEQMGGAAFLVMAALCMLALPLCAGLRLSPGQA